MKKLPYLLLIVFSPLLASFAIRMLSDLMRLIIINDVTYIVMKENIYLSSKFIYAASILASYLIYKDKFEK